MHTQAAFKALAVVLTIGALTGFNDWRNVSSVPPEIRAQRDISQCVRDRQTTAYRENSMKFGHHVTQQNQQFEAECRTQQVNGLQLGKGAAQVGPIKPSSSGPVEVDGRHYSPSGQVQTQSREQCLARLEEARKRSPHGLAYEWEKTQKIICAGLYVEPTGR